MTPSPEPPGGGAAPADPQRTVVEPRSVAEPREAGGAALPVGLALQEFVIEGLIGEGGFGIVYSARDTRLDRVVALKEYMPTNLAQRGSDRSVSVRSERYRETFVLGLRSFVNEAKLLASFDHPALVKVYRFWEENGTAYMVMPFYEGPTLRQHLATLGQAPDEAWLRALLAPLIDALELIHNDHCWHRDIAPDNILLLAPQKTQSGQGPQLRPLLLDFGAARRVIGDVTHNLTVILKPGYAPIEQYAESESMRQGAWTDVYALCAVLYVAITGRAPVPSVSRIISDDMVSAVQAGAGRYSQAFLAAIDAGLAVRPDARPQSMAALREHFDIGPARAPQSGAAAPREAAAAAAQASPAQGARNVDARAAAAGGKAALRSPASMGADAREARSRAGGIGSDTARKRPLMVAGFVVLVAAAASFGWWLERSTTAQRTPVPASQEAPQQRPQQGGQIAPLETPSAAAPIATQSAPAVVPAASPATADAPASAAAPAPVAAPAPAPAVKAPSVAAPVKAGAPATTAAARPAAPRASAFAVPALTPPAAATPTATTPARAAAPETAALPATAPTQPTPAPAPVQPALDPKRFECEVLVRAGQKALANRSYDDAMQRADEALAAFADCPGAAELGRNARQAKDRARSSAVIQ